jgi:hypothetical protein
MSGFVTASLDLAPSPAVCAAAVKESVANRAAANRVRKSFNTFTTFSFSSVLQGSFVVPRAR